MKEGRIIAVFRDHKDILWHGVIALALSILFAYFCYDSFTYGTLIMSVFTLVFAISNITGFFYSRMVITENAIIQYGTFGKKTVFVNTEIEEIVLKVIHYHDSTSSNDEDLIFHFKNGDRKTTGSFYRQDRQLLEAFENAGIKVTREDKYNRFI